MPFLVIPRSLLRGGFIGNTRTIDNIYQVAEKDWHSSIVTYYGETAGSWVDKDWSQVDTYGLRYLTGHLYALHDTDGYNDQLHALLETRPFVDQRLAHSANPNPILDDLRLGLDLALQENSLAHIWQHILDYRRALYRAQDFQQLAQSVRAGDYSAAMERTVLYGALPNAQALARLWIAWVAAANGQNEAALTSARQALDHLPPRGVVRGGGRQEDSEAASSVGDAIGEALQRLLLRIARTVGSTIEEQTAWLDAAARSWPPNAVQDLDSRVTGSLDAWGAILDAQYQNLTMSQLLDELANRRHGIDADVNFREASFFYQRQLGAGLFNTRGAPQWLEYVKRAVELVALDDYPSYREMALAWVFSAVLAQADEDWARTAFSTILAGMFKPSPSFWGDSIVAALDGMHKESQQPADPNYLQMILEDVEAKNDRSVDPTVMFKPQDVIAWRVSVGLPPDPWSFQMRRQSAIAAVLYRRGDITAAEQTLRQAGQASPQGSYAGYRTLARLSLACRWLEWNNPTEALTQVQAAAEDASHMLDPVLRQERDELVQKMLDWTLKYHDDPATFDQQDSVSLVHQETGMARLLFLEFLSAIWHADAARLRQLIPLALEDATTIDAMVGHLLGLEAQQSNPSRPFLNLCRAMICTAPLRIEYVVQ
jgi:hypothetical protein